MTDEVNVERPTAQRPSRENTLTRNLQEERRQALGAPTEHEEMFAKAIEAVTRHFQAKNAPDHYGGAFEATGLIGSAVDINGISARLRHIVVRSGDGGEHFDREKLLELLKDLAVDAVLGMICLADDNFLGK